jgi:DNA repair exonuclease SbcCD nuclease subunit
MLDIRDRIGELMHTAIARSTKYIFVLGDLFKDRTPNEFHRLVISNFFHLCEQNNIQVRVILGNHDLPRVIGQLHPLMAFTPLLPDNVKIYAEPTIEEIEGVKFYFMPFAGPPQLPHLEKFIKGSTADDVLVMHGLVQGAVAGVYEYELSDGDVIPMDTIKHFKGVLAGDVHKPQRIGNVWYPGALERLTFNDENEDRSFYIMRFGKAVTAESVLVHARKMVTLRADQLDLSNVKDAIVRVLNAKATDVEAIKRQLEQAGCYYVASVRTTETEVKQVQQANAVSVPDLVKQYAAKTQYTGDLASATRLIMDTLASI